MFAWQELFSFFFLVFFYNLECAKQKLALACASLPLSQIGNSSVKMYLVFFLSLSFCEVRRHIIKKELYLELDMKLEMINTLCSALLSPISLFLFLFLSLRSFSVYHVCFFKI